MHECVSRFYFVFFLRVYAPACAPSHAYIIKMKKQTPKKIEKLPRKVFFSIYIMCNFKK